MLMRGLAQLLVPTGDFELFAGSEREGAREVDRSVGARGMGASALGRLREKHVADGVDEDPPPEVLQVIESLAKLGGAQASPFAHSGKGCGCLDVGDRSGPDAIGVAVDASCLLGSRLIDQQLDQGAGIEIEAQRRPSVT